MKIGDLKLEMISGQIVQRLIHDQKSEIEAVDSKRKTIVAKTVGEGVINDEDVVINDYDKLSDEKRITKEGDLIVKLPSPTNACLIDEDHAGMLISSFCMVIRNIEGIDKNYLLAYFNSDYCRERLDASMSGALMHIASIGKIKELDIPVPSIEEQKKIGDYFTKMVEKKQLIKKIESLEEEKLKSLFVEAEK